jgi:hypothetical protein
MQSLLGANDDFIEMKFGKNNLKDSDDPDVDEFLNEAEIAAGSNSCKADSIPKDTTISLTHGFSIVATPVELMFRSLTFARGGSINLRTGTNLIGFVCPSVGSNAFDLLNA